MDNPEKLATLGTQDTRRRKTKTKQKPQHNMCWIPLCTNKHTEMLLHLRTLFCIGVNLYLP